MKNVCVTFDGHGVIDVFDAEGMSEEEMYETINEILREFEYSCEGWYFEGEE